MGNTMKLPLCEKHGKKMKRQKIGQYSCFICEECTAEARKVNGRTEDRHGHILQKTPSSRP
jgi:hypothetical protein